MAEGTTEQSPRNKETVNERVAQTYFMDLGLNWEMLKGRRILDLGAGLARFAQAAKKREVDVVSLDAHPEWWSDEGVPPTDVPYIIGDGRRLPFKDESFDLIVARASVDSMVEIEEDLVRVLGEAKRVLRPGGEFRFGPGHINVRPVREGEWDKWFEIQDKVGESRELTPEEQSLREKILPEYEKEEEQRALEGLSTEDRIRRLAEFSLERLRSINPSIEMHPITRTVEGRTEEFDSVYYVMRKPSE